MTCLTMRALASKLLVEYRSTVKDKGAPMMQRWMAVMAVVAAMLLAPVQAQTKANGAFTLQPGGVATITFEAFCTEFGKFFPQTIVEPTSVAPDKIRAALSYVQQKGYAADGKQALEANFGIWQIAGATRATGGGTITQDVIKNATVVPTDPTGTSILEAAKAGQIKLTLASWAPIGDKVAILSATDNFYGRGTLTVENTSTQALTLYMPVGTAFPGSEARFQVMGGYPTDVVVKNPSLPNTSGPEFPITLIALFACVLLALGWTLRSRKAS